MIAVEAPEELVDRLVRRVEPIETALNHAWWDSYTSSSAEADARRESLELQWRNAHADPDDFAAIRSALAASGIAPDVRRQLVILHDRFVPQQVAPELREKLVGLETEVDSAFTNSRGEIDGRPVDDNEIAKILRSSDDGGERRSAWEASKQVGGLVGDRVRELARLRNEAARALGYRDHYALALSTGDLDETRLLATLAEVEAVTAAPFRAWKEQLDLRLAARFGIAVEELRPWHYDDPFFQELPVSGRVDLDELFADADLEDLTRRTYRGIGLDVEAVLERSDLRPRAGKSQHAFCIDVDRAGDVRVLANIAGNERWAETMLHEFGHAVYDVSQDRSRPWLLRGPTHALTTEAVAMLFGRLARDPGWLAQIAGVDPARLQTLDAELRASKAASLLVAVRWMLVMITFERELYADPDADLDARWWELVERFQLVTRPDGRNEPDWAAKIHLASAPVYYQNYLYGEMVASQLDATLEVEAGGVVGQPEAGRFLVERVFRPGASLRWDELVAAATGTPLSASHLERDITA
jgi:peptidyl-dipeptidase A